MRSDVERLRDILDAADGLARRVHRGRAAFDVNEDTRLAMVRLLEIVGEACGAVSQGVRERFPEVPWLDAARLRNRIIHGYFDVNLDIVWDSAEREIPRLADQVRTVLAAIGSDPWE